MKEKQHIEHRVDFGCKNREDKKKIRMERKWNEQFNN